MLDFESLNNAIRENGTKDVAVLDNEVSKAEALLCINSFNKITSALWYAESTLDFDCQEKIIKSINTLYEFAAEANFVDGEKRYITEKLTELKKLYNEFRKRGL